MEYKISRRSLFAAAGALAGGTALPGAALAAQAAGADAKLGAPRADSGGGEPANIRAGRLASPEGSVISIVNGKPMVPPGAPNYDPKAIGNPYLTDVNGVIFQFVIDASGNVVAKASPGQPSGYAFAINGNQNPNGATELMITQGQFWFAGNWGATLFWYGPGGAHGNAPPPPLNAPRTPGTVGGMPADPTPASVAPGSSGNVILCGPSQTIKTLTAAVAAAKPGDTIKLDAGATFNESVAIPVPVTIDGRGTVANPGLKDASFSGGAVIDGTGIADPGGYAHELGGLVPLTDCIIRGCEVRGFGLQETSPGGTAGIRAGANGHITIDNCYVHDCQMGLFSGGFTVDWLIRETLLLNCGLGSGAVTGGGGVTHNMYLAGAVRVRVENVTSICPAGNTKSSLRTTGYMGGGHALKVRAAETIVVGGYFAAPDASPIDIPDGSAEACFVYGATIHKNRGDVNYNVFSYGEESQTQGTAGAIVVATLDVKCKSPFFQIGPNSVVDFTGSNAGGVSFNVVGGGKAIGV
jgi:hypothetical protein